MARKAQDITDAELAIMQILWERGKATVRELTIELYPTETGSDLATVQKLLKRLESKEFVQRERESWPHIFRPLLQRTDLIERRLLNTANVLCEGSIAPLLTCLVKSKPLSREDRDRLRDLLKELDR